MHQSNRQRCRDDDEATCHTLASKITGSHSYPRKRTAAAAPGRRGGGRMMIESSRLDFKLVQTVFKFDVLSLFSGIVVCSYASPIAFCFGVNIFQYTLNRMIRASSASWFTVQYLPQLPSDSCSCCIVPKCPFRFGFRLSLI